MPGHQEVNDTLLQPPPTNPRARSTWLTVDVWHSLAVMQMHPDMLATPPRKKPIIGLW